MLKVFQAYFNIDWGSGIMLIAANDEAQANEMIDNINIGLKTSLHENGNWTYSNERQDLLCPLEKPQVLESFTVI